MHIAPQFSLVINRHEAHVSFYKNALCILATSKLVASLSGLVSANIRLALSNVDDQPFALDIGWLVQGKFAFYSFALSVILKLCLVYLAC